MMGAKAQGLVVRSTAGFVNVLIDGEVMQCRLRGRLKQAPRTTDICVIGDQVIVEDPESSSRVVSEVLSRDSRFSRGHPGRGPVREVVLVAIVDLLVVTFCYGLAHLKPLLVVRFLVIGENEGVSPVFVMN